MKRIPRVSDTEWEIMKIIWAQAPCSAGEVIKCLTDIDPTWHPKTVKTFLTRLVAKGVLDFERDGHSYRYRPLVTEKECVQVASESFLDRVFSGSLKPMLAHFVENKRLTPEEIKELRRLLDEKES
jgi:BlaI family penicillinase repressor